MKHQIDPMVDIVFKSIFGNDHRIHVLESFLNALLKRDGANALKITQIINPFNLKNSSKGRSTIIDVKAIDQNKVIYQIEIQLDIHASLKERILYSFCQIYDRRLVKEKNQKLSYNDLKPVISTTLPAKVRKFLVKV